MSPKDRKAIKEFLREDGNKVDRAFRAEQAQKAVERLLEAYDELRYRMDGLEK